MTKDEVKEQFIKSVDVVKLPEGRVYGDDENWQKFQSEYVGIRGLYAKDAPRAWNENACCFVEWEDEWAVVVQRNPKRCGNPYKEVIATL